MEEAATNLTEIATSYIPQTRALNTGVRIAWWVCLLAIIIAIILIIISIYEFSQGNTGAGWGLMITGGILGGVGGFGMQYTNRGLGGILVSRAEDSPAARLFKKIMGKGEESNFEGDTVVDAGEYSGGADGCGCHSSSGGREFEEFDEDINELDYIESSDDEEENPFEDEEPTEKEEKKQHPKPKHKKKGKKVHFKGGDELSDSLAKIIDILAEESADEMKEIQDILNASADADLGEVLDNLMNKMDVISAAYKKLDSDKKGEVDILLDLLPSQSDDEFREKIEEFKSRF